MGDSGRNERPPALFIAPIMPGDRGNGLAMRTGFLLDAYVKRFDIDLAVVPISGGSTELTPFVRARARRSIVLRSTVPSTHFALISRIVDAHGRLAAFRQYARPSITAGLSDELKRALVAFVGDAAYELVHISRLYLAELSAPWTKARGRPPSLVLDCDEDDVSAFRCLARLHRKGGRDQRADWAEAEADAFKVMARRWLPGFDLLLAASRSEARLLETHAPGVRVSVIPNVVPADALRSAVRCAVGGRRNVIFVGNMSYLPNIDAVMWFALCIWPKLRSAAPFPIRFVIAGPEPPRQVMDLARHPGIVVAGAVEDVGSLYRRAALAVVPIRAGGGTRIKVLESTSYGVPVVATRFGAAGTGLRSERELLLADTSREFAASCARLLADGRLASRLAAQARKTVRREYDPVRCAVRLLAAIDAYRGME